MATNKKNVWDYALGYGDAAATLGSSLVAEPVSGYAGILAGLSGYDPRGAIDAVQQGMTWSPRTDIGRGALEDLGSGVQSLLDYRAPLSPGGMSAGEQFQWAGDKWRDDAVPWLQEHLGDKVGSASAATGVGLLGSVFPGPARQGRQLLKFDDLYPDLHTSGGSPVGLPVPTTAAGGNPGVLALPNPARARAENAEVREAKWQALEKATKDAGVKRSKKTGQYAGAAPGIASPQKRTALVNKYAQRTQNSLDAGIPPGYFYEEGSNKLAQITDSVEEHKRVADMYGPTSTMVGPKDNTNYVIRALDQQAMGVPTSVTLYPNKNREIMEQIAGGEEPWMGEKLDRYAYLLGPQDPSAHRMQQMPPRDQWEGYGTGREKGQVPSGHTQVAFSDDIAIRANDKINKLRVAEGKKPLALKQGQELHWAAIRAEEDGRPLQINPNDTVQGALDQFRAQSAWEAEPGPQSGIDRLGSKEDYADEVYGVLADEKGKDKLTRAMGGRLQEPIVRGSGIWEGVLSPGFQTPTFASHTGARGLDPASNARLDSTEAVRQYMLGQAGRAYSLNQRGGRGKDYSAADVTTGSPPTPEQHGILTNRMGDNAAILPTADGYRAIDIKDRSDTGPGLIRVDDRGVGKTAKQWLEGPPEPTFEQEFRRISNDGILGKNIGDFDQSMDWEGGNATRDMLADLDKSGYPGPKRFADSPETRQIAGEVSDMYKRLESEGLLSPNHKLTAVLDGWRTGGLERVRQMVAQGLAPAVVLSLFAGSDEPQAQDTGALSARSGT